MKKEEPFRIAQVMGKWVGGGVEAVVMNYYRHIDRSKIQFDFICDDDSTNIPYDEINKLGGKVILIPPYQKVFKYHKELKKVLKEGNYKIVHSHINTLSVFSLFAAKCAGVPVRIAHSHSTTNKKEWKRNIIKQILRTFSKIFATNYMCCSELAGRWLFGDGEYDKGNVYLLNNAVDTKKFNYNPKIRNRKRKELGIANDNIVIGHVGRFVSQKNHEFIIDVFKKLHAKNDKIVLLLVGEGPMINTIKKKTEDEGLKGSVFFLGQRNDVNEMYQVMDLFIFPSLEEGLGMALVEAQLSGLPCISSTFVPTSSRILMSTKYIPLSEGVTYWQEEIEKMIKESANRKKKISSDTYNISMQVEKLENKYLEMMSD